MSKKVVGQIMTAAGLLLASLVACGGGDAEPAVAAISEADAERAAALYQEQACTICHGESAEGMEGAGPALRALAPYWDVDRLVAYLEDPEGFRRANPDFEERREVEYDLEMPAFDHLSDEQRHLLAGWLMAR